MEDLYDLLLAAKRAISANPKPPVAEPCARCGRPVSFGSWYLMDERVWHIECVLATLEQLRDYTESK